jgi:hypothetical protein
MSIVKEIGEILSGVVDIFNLTPALPPCVLHLVYHFNEGFPQVILDLVNERILQIPEKGLELLYLSSLLRAPRTQ